MFVTTSVFLRSPAETKESPLALATWSINYCYLAACIGCRMFVRTNVLSLQLLISEIFAFELDFTTGCALLN